MIEFAERKIVRNNSKVRLGRQDVCWEKLLKKQLFIPPLYLTLTLKSVLGDFLAHIELLNIYIKS